MHVHVHCSIITSTFDYTFYSINIISIESSANGVEMLPLYEGARINAETSWSVIMKYAVTHKLLYLALGDLIDLVKVHNLHL